MLDGILGRGYSSKCKSLMKLTKSRIEVIRRKRNATLKFLKKDMADLLAKGLEINAYGRAEGLLAELIMSSCYEYVDKSCDFVLKHLSVMQKIRHCPEDCKEAVSSLMFAAARFSDLPELRDLRDVFLERYGSSLELFANKEFVEHLSANPITAEKKIRLMREIASEFNIPWDSKGFEQRTSNPSPILQEQRKVPESYDNKYTSAKGKDSIPRGNFDISPEKRHQISNNGHRIETLEKNSLNRNELNSQPNHEFPNNRYNLLDPRDKHSLKLKEAPEVIHNPWIADTPSKKPSSSNSSQRKKPEISENSAPITHKNPDIHPIQAGSWSKSDNSATNSVRDIQQEAQKSSFYHNNPIPPPYTKPDSKPKDTKSEGSERPEKILVENEGQNGQSTIPTENGGRDFGISNTIPKPRSSRRRPPSKSRSTHDGVDLDLPEGSRRRSKSSRRRKPDDSRRGLQVLFDDEHNERDEEERMIDRLLIHYSKKPSGSEGEMVKRKPRSQHRSNERISPLDDRVPNKPVEISENVELPPRSISLPREQTGQTGQTETGKVFNRAASFQPERSSAAKHVHPKLPDYDDLAARFAALKGGR